MIACIIELTYLLKNLSTVPMGVTNKYIGFIPVVSFKRGNQVSANSMPSRDLINLGDFFNRDPILTPIIPCRVNHLYITRFYPALYILDLVGTDLSTIEHEVKFH